MHSPPFSSSFLALLCLSLSSLSLRLSEETPLNLFLSSLRTSTRCLGWAPSPRCRSACFISSPISSTAVDVPSPVASSTAEAARAIITAVGLWICMSRRSTLPSLVSLTSPAPPTSILIVPLGPRLDFRTAARPLAALMFMKRAAAGPMTSALGLSVLTEEADAIFGEEGEARGGGKEEKKKGMERNGSASASDRCFVLDSARIEVYFPSFLHFAAQD